MEIIEIIEKINIFLEKSIIFRGIRFMLGIYLVVLVLVIVGILYRIGKIYWVILIAGQEFPVTKGKMQKRWEKVLELINSKNELHWKAAILEASNMLFEILEIIGYEGKNLEDKLNNLLSNQLENLEEVKEAALIRRRIVKEKDFKISQKEARAVLEVFAKSLRFFEAIN